MAAVPSEARTTAAQAAAQEDALLRLGPFRGVPQAAVRELLAVTTLVSFPAERVLFLQGDPLSEDAWLLVTGRLSVLVASGSQQRVMADVWPGEIVGEAALYARGRARSATVMTVGPSVLLRIPRSALIENDSQPALIALELFLLETMAKRLRSTNVVLQRVVNEQRHGLPKPTAPGKAAQGARATGGPPKTGAAVKPAVRPATPRPPSVASGGAPESTPLSLAQRLSRWFKASD
jgi:CRP-like cAMP-binding protein